jgi:hypothetical protein
MHDRRARVVDQLECLREDDAGEARLGNRLGGGEVCMIVVRGFVGSMSRTFLGHAAPEPISVGAVLTSSTRRESVTGWLQRKRSM